MWLLAAAVACSRSRYRFYARFIANACSASTRRARRRRCAATTGSTTCRPTAASLFGHHFAAIAGAGPLVGPVLAAQMGYLPGMLWILVGVVLAGAVQDMLVLFLSTRRDGRSLGEMIRARDGPRRRQRSRWSASC